MGAAGADGGGVGWGGNLASCLGSPQCQVGPDSRTHRQTSEMAFGGGSYLIIFFLIVLTAKGILLVFSVTFRPLKCWGRQQESPPPFQSGGVQQLRRNLPRQGHTQGWSGHQCSAKEGVASLGPPAAAPSSPPSPMLPARRCRKGGFPYSQPNQLWAHTELKQGGNRLQRQVPSR